MTILTNGPRLPGAQPFGALVEIELVGEGGAAVAGYVTGTDEVVQSQLQFHADGKNALSPAVGEWAVDLTPNASIEPAGTVYRIVEQRGRSGSTTHIVSVPATGGPYTILECITDLPGSLPFGPLLVHLNDATDAHDASAVSVVPSASLAAATVQAALDELAAEATTEAATRSTADTALASDLADESVARTAADTALAAADTVRIANQQVANYTLVLSDAGKAVEGNSASALSFTVPPNSSVAYPTGTIIEVVQVGAGAVTLVPGSGVTITGDTATPGEGGSLLLRKTGTNAWFSAIASVRSGTYAEYVAGAGIDKTGATDSTAAMNTLIATASTAAVAAGRVTELRWADGTYLTDGIIVKPNVHYNFGNAVFKKRVDGTTPNTNSMLRAVPVPVATVATVTNKVLTSNVATLTTAAPHPFVVGSVAIVAGVDATFNGTYTVTAVPTTTSFSYAKTAANVAPTASGGTATRTTYYGTYKNMTLTGGTFDPNGKTCPAHIINLIYTEDLEMDGVTVLHDPANLTWAFCLGGRDGKVDNCKVTNGTEVFQDGIHLLHGQRWQISGNNIACGDDAIPLGGEPTDAYLSIDPDPIQHVNVLDNVVVSESGFAFKPYVQAGANGPLWQVSDVVVNGLSGTAGRVRNGGLAFLGHLDQMGDGNTNMIKRVSVDGVNLTVGSTDHDNVNAFGAWVESVDGLDLSGDIRFGGEGTTGFKLATVLNSRDVSVDKFHCDELPKGFGFDVRDTRRFSLLRSRLKMAAGELASLNPVYLDDCPDAKILDNRFLNMRHGVNAIAIVAGTTTSGSVRGNTVTKGVGATAGTLLQVSAGTTTWLEVGPNDLSGAAESQALADIPRSANYETMRSASGRMDAVATQTLVIGENGTAAPAGSLGGFSVFRLDPADWPGGVTPKLRIRVIVSTNATAPTSTFTFGLYPVTASAGGAAAVSVTLGAVVAGSTAVVAAPAASTPGVTAESGEFDCPAAGAYALGVALAPSMVASSAVAARVALLSRAS